MIPDPDAANIARLMFEMYVEPSMSFGDIARYLVPRRYAGALRETPRQAERRIFEKLDRAEHVRMRAVRRPSGCFCGQGNSRYRGMRR